MTLLGIWSCLFGLGGLLFELEGEKGLEVVEDRILSREAERRSAVLGIGIWELMMGH